MNAVPIQSVDIAICTWNRQDLLQQTLESLAELEIGSELALHVIVVDNASTDQTPELLAQWKQSEFPSRARISVARETQQGHTFARNHAIEISEGDLVLWTDDDVRVPKDWVTRFAAAAANSDFDFWGGAIEPDFVDGRPNWINENWDALKGCFAARQLGQDPIEFNESRLPYGANFAVRGHIQRRYCFETALGRRGDEVLGEDELDLMRRLLENGIRGQWVPGQPVQHRIPPDRATTDYVYNYFFGQGRALAAKGNGWETDVQRLLAEAKREHRRFRWKRWFAPSNAWCSHLIRSALARGQAEHLQEAAND